MNIHRRFALITTLVILLSIGFSFSQAARSPSQAQAPTIQLRAVSPACYESSVRDGRIPADGWRVNFRAGGSNCLTLSSFSGADGELVGIVCCTGAVALCQDQLMVTGLQAGRVVFTISRTINCP
jgi:hypothetical protein